MKAIAFLTFLLAGWLPATDYHVSPFGDDVTGDGSLLSPWRSVTQATTAVVSGDRILVGGGTYDSFSGESFPITSGDHKNFSCSDCHLIPNNFVSFSCTH
ncbi:MAG: DUF1565 domain-containing protein, partial [Planctomycetota bacterium]|nr:DUF1565 domain-containing protein [Planctomycetota bacterium]